MNISSAKSPEFVTAKSSPLDYSTPAAEQTNNITAIGYKFREQQKPRTENAASASVSSTATATATATASAMTVFNRPCEVTKVGPASGRSRSAASTPAVWKAALGFRVSEVVVCLISFSVMAADKTQGWSGDSFDRYKEYRYCLSVNVIASAYAGLQACDLAYQLVTGKHIINHHLRYHFDFFMDQVLAYLLISATSSAATRVYDWQSNWGKDEFTEMASASIAMAFLSFIAFAISSLISGYNLYSARNSISI